MKTQEAREIGNKLAELLSTGDLDGASTLLDPVLGQPVPFRLLDVIGHRAGGAPPELVNPFLDRIAARRTMGGWVVIGRALSRQIEGNQDFSKLGRAAQAFSRCRVYIMEADTWYATDILGERVPGPALLACFDPVLSSLADWREDPNRWVRRTVGVAAHFWAKRAHGDPAWLEQANQLLEFLEPMFSEGNLDAIKGVGWGLKTLGRYYPDQVAGWLAKAVRSPHRALMRRKALTYLSPQVRARVMGEEL